MYTVSFYQWCVCVTNSFGRSFSFSLFRFLHGWTMNQMKMIMWKTIYQISMNVFSMHKFIWTFLVCSHLSARRKLLCVSWNRVMFTTVYFGIFFYILWNISMWKIVIIYAQHLTSFFIFPSILWRARSKFFFPIYIFSIYFVHKILIQTHKPFIGNNNNNIHAATFCSVANVFV